MSRRLAAQIQYALLPFLILIAIFAVAAGGAWHYLVAAMPIILATFVDELTGDQHEDGPYLTALLNAYLLSCLPLIAVFTALLCYYAGGAGPLSGPLEGVFLTFGIDVAANREATGMLEFTVAIIGAGLLMGSGAVNVAHELTHRMNARDYLVGRWLLAFTFDTTFAIEHVHGHHRNVGTKADPATARRGEYVLSFVVRSTVFAFLGAFEIEAERARRKGHSPYSPILNRAIRGQFMTLALIIMAYLIGGWPGVFVFTVVGLQGKLYLELVNYVEHYGLVRLPGTRIEPRHSWNCNRFVSNLMLFNLPRHSHHHQFATKPFWDLESLDGAPLMPHGYLTMLIIALFPPLWNAKVEPRLLEWERNLASDGEREIMRAQREDLGLKAA
ncbi:MAG: alkane 1-monooxygenase [Pseudomonadota bacterium]